MGKMTGISGWRWGLKMGDWNLELGRGIWIEMGIQVEVYLIVCGVVGLIRNCHQLKITLFLGYSSFD